MPLCPRMARWPPSLRSRRNGRFLLLPTTRRWRRPGLFPSQTGQSHATLSRPEVRDHLCRPCRPSQHVLPFWGPQPSPCLCPCPLSHGPLPPVCADTCSPCGHISPHPEISDSTSWSRNWPATCGHLLRSHPPTVWPRWRPLPSQRSSTHCRPESCCCSRPSWPVSEPY